MTQYFDFFCNQLSAQNENKEKALDNFSEPIFFNGCFDKNQVKLLVSWFLSKYGEKKTIDFLEKLKYMGFHNATQAGISLGLEDLEIPPDKATLISQATAEMNQIDRQSALGALTSVEKSQSLIDTWNQTSELLRQNAVQNFKNRNCVNPVYMMAFSGARGNISQVRQLVAMRGLMADPQGAILEFPIQSNFREGLTITEYLISCYGARKGLVDTALRTATSGYLTRRLVDSAQHAVIAMKDCNTRNGIKLLGKNIESRLLGRVLVNEIRLHNNVILERNHLIDNSSAKILVKHLDQVLIRSPLTCESQTTVCKMCYGSNLATGKLVTLGETVGVIAAQSIGEPGTQLTMRTFHTGGVGVFSDQAIKPILSPYDGKIEFIENLSGQFVRTPYGNIRYMVKYISKKPNRILARIRPSIPNNEDFLIHEFDLPSGSLLVVKHGEFVKTNQLLAQASQLKLTKQKFPESSHPVYSPVEGQVFFESMNVSIQKENLLPPEFFKKEIPNLNKPQSSLTTYSTSKGLPDIRTMSKIGSFWVLAGHNQSEVHSAESFFSAGDLISPNNLLFQYNFYSSEQQQIKTINKNLGLGYSAFEIPVFTTNFNSGAYNFQFKKEFTDSLIYKNIGKNKFLEEGFIWYVQSNTNLKQNLFYTYLISEYLDLELENSEATEKNFANKTPNYLKDVRGNFFNLKQNIKIVSQSTFSSKENHRISENSNLVKTEFYIYKHIKNSLDYSKFLLIKNKNQKLKLLNTKNSLSNNSNPNSKSNFNSFCEARSFQSSFVYNSLENVFNKFFPIKSTLYTQDKTGWLYLSSHTRNLSDLEVVTRKFVKPTKTIDGVSMPKSYFSIEYIPFHSILTKKSNRISLNNFSTSEWYNLENLLKINSSNEQQEILGSIIENDGTNSNSNFIQLSKPRIWFKNLRFKKVTGSKYQFNRKLNIPNKIKKSYLFINFTLLKESQLLESQSLKRRWSGLNLKQNLYKQTNPLFSKQYSTKLTKIKPKTLDFLIQIPQNPGWLFSKTLMRINLKIPTDSIFFQNKNVVQYGSNKTYFNSILSLFSYQYLVFQQSTKFSFQTFYDDWVLPSCEFTRGYIPIKNFGEFQNIDYKQNGTITSVLRPNDFKTISFPSALQKQDRQKVSKSSIKLGSMIRWGDELLPGIGSPINGQIIKIQDNKVTVRLGTPFLASNRGIVHIFQNELVHKNQLLVTLKSRRLQTEDIVQGIPKIEQLFEARESQSGQILHDTVHSRLKGFFITELENSGKNHWSVAVQNSFLQAQQFLVEGIVEAYGKQGVKISEKHVEVIVRQMTSRVRIISGGETGLLPGELVDHRWIQIFNKQLKEIGLREATYEPMVLGISKSVLQSDSFLLAASFQEVSRVLVKSALSKKRDFLRGLHENVIVGQIIPAGTGLLSHTEFDIENVIGSSKSIGQQDQLF